MIRYRTRNEALSNELRDIKNMILSNREVLDIQKKVYRNNTNWKDFRALIKAIEKSDPRIRKVAYGLTNNKSFVEGDRVVNGVVKDRARDIVVETTEGNIEGRIVCFGAGSVDDPLESYDMTLQLW